MKVLFVASGNKHTGVSTIIDAQRVSLQEAGVDIELFLIRGKGWKNYFHAVFLLRKRLRSESFDIVHAHYSFSSWVAILAGAKNIVCSLMGSDVKSKFLFKWLIKFLLLPFCRAVIVKSDEMRRDLSYRRAIVIPNGVNTDDFQPMSSESAKMMLGWSKEKLHILFPSDPERPEKNFDLLLSGVKKSGIAHYEIHTMGVVPFHEMNTYYNASDLVCMTSTREGSPNAIKEAMACDKIIVSTEVGDVQWLFGSTDGLFLAAHDAVSYSEVLIRALNFSGSNGLKSKGRERILDLKMTSRQIAERIKAVYTAITLESNWSRKSL